MAAALRWNLFVYRDLKEWLNDPTAWNIEPPPIEQLTLAIPGIGLTGRICGITVRSFMGSFMGTVI
jgi:hypothetical protein